MNSVALSVYLALATALSHNLGFVVLDDPSQSLDVEHKAALVSILREMATRTQLVVATQDSELQDLLRRELLGEGSRAFRGVLAEFYRSALEGSAALEMALLSDRVNAHGSRPADRA